MRPRASDVYTAQPVWCARGEAVRCWPGKDHCSQSEASNNMSDPQDAAARSSTSYFKMRKNWDDLR